MGCYIEPEIRDGRIRDKARMRLRKVEYDLEDRPERLMDHL